MIDPKEFKPLRCCSIDGLTQVKLPVYASFKHDGIRCELMVSPRSGNRLAASRKILPIPNNHIRKTLRESNIPTWVSGELIVGNNFQETESAVMSAEGEPDFTYWLFDYPGFGYSYGFEQRYEALRTMVLPSYCRIIEHVLITSYQQLIEFEQQAFDLGYEGIVLRRPSGRYKYGKSTLLDGLCHRYVRLERFDCEVIGFNEKLNNENVLETDYLGYAKRSKSKAGMIPSGVCGSVVVRALHATTKTPKGCIFNLTISEHKLQREIWKNQSAWMGRILVGEFKPYGSKDKPRQPVFLRERLDAKL